MHSTCRLATHELQDDKLSVRKATLTCKKQGFLTLGALRPGLTPPFTQHVEEGESNITNAAACWIWSAIRLALLPAW